jgi:hypothetical protein
MQKAHDLARKNLKAAQKTMKRDHDVRSREHQFRVGDVVYWRRNVGKKVESVWMGPGVVVEKKSDTVFAVKSRREVKIMHHDKIKKCEARMLPKWLIEFKNKLSSNETTVNSNAVSFGSDSEQTGIVREEPTKKGGVPCLGPYLGTRSRDTSMSKSDTVVEVPSKQRKRAVGKNQKSYCLCKKQKPKGLMVQCDYCRDWFHPGCVGISPDEAKNIPVYTCPECSLVDH